MNIVLVSKLDDYQALEYTSSLADFLTSEGNTITFERGTGVALDEDRLVDFRDISGDMVVVVGGDGSILLTVQQMKTQVPVLGINWGEVGFLTDLEPDDARPFFTLIQSRGFEISKRMRISIAVDGNQIGDALNEAVIVTSRPAKMLRFSVIIDGVQAEQLRADGLLVSTPTGSTAYAMSAGGPIIDPRIEGFLLVPLGPYHLYSRPHIISEERELYIQLESKKPAKLVIDGQRTFELKDEMKVRFKKSDDPALFVDVGKNFFYKVENKLRKL